MRLIDANEIKDVVEYMCSQDDSKESVRWCRWFMSVIDGCTKMEDWIVDQINDIPNVVSNDKYTRPITAQEIREKCIEIIGKE